MEDTKVTEIGNLWNETDQLKAARLVKAGFPIGIFNRGVCAIIIDGGDRKTKEKSPAEIIREIKGEKREINRPLAACFTSMELVEFLDKTKVPKKLQHIFLDAEELANRTGSLCFIRVPITKNAAQKLPQCMVSYLPDNTPVLQNWDPLGHKPTYQLFEKIKSLGVKYPAITSMNISGEKEIVDQQLGIKFSHARLPFFLEDPYSNKDIIGSYTIFGIDSNGLELIRDGNVPSFLFSPIFDYYKIRMTEKTKKANHKQAVFPSELLSGKNPSEVRIAIISFLNKNLDKKTYQ